MHEAGDVNIKAIAFSIFVIFVVYQFIKRQFKAAEARNKQILKLQRLAAEEVAWAEWQAAEEFRAARAAERNTSLPSQALRANFITEQSIEGYGLSPEQAETDRASAETFIQSPHIAAVAISSAASAPPHEISDPGSSRASPSLGVCILCTAPTNKQCARCKAVKYCSQRCQVKHWFEGHKHECHLLEKQLRNSALQSTTLSHNNNLQHTKATSDKNGKKAFLEGTSTVKSPQWSDTVAMNGRLSSTTTVLFPYDQFVKLFTWNKLKLPPCGLLNCGNSCFANVVLQCLTYTRPLAAYLLEQYHMNECQQNVWCFMCELQKHVMSVSKSQAPFSPVNIVSKMCNIGNHMDYGRQEDAHEFMRLAIDSMQTICLTKVGGEKAVDRVLWETTFIQHVFGGCLQSQVRCLQCHHESYKYENMMDLAVEIQGNIETLEDALTRFTAPEWLDHDNKYKCDRCNAYVKAWKRLMIHEAPNVLTIALKRFQSGKFGKLNKRVIFSNLLDMIPFMSEEGDKPPPYELYGVVVHIDMENASFYGHYVCYIKAYDGFWYEIDDDKVKMVDLENVMQQRAYMLLYQRCGPRQVPLISGHVHAASANSGVRMSGGK